MGRFELRMMCSSSVWLEPEEIKFIKKVKNRMKQDGITNISQSKIIRYAVKKLENEEYNKIVANMEKNNIINGQAKSNDNI